MSNTLIELSQKKRDMENCWLEGVCQREQDFMIKVLNAVENEINAFARHCQLAAENNVLIEDAYFPSHLIPYLNQFFHQRKTNLFHINENITIEIDNDKMIVHLV